MSNLGLGVMIGILGGNEENVNAVRSSIGRTISEITLEDDVILIAFTDRTELRIRDDGQSCCESRYVTTDDNLTHIKNTVLLNIEIVEAANGSMQQDDDVHEIQFLRIHTDKGVVVFQTHNEHNGYYGGFYIKARFS